MMIRNQLVSHKKFNIENLILYNLCTDKKKYITYTHYRKLTLVSSSSPPQSVLILFIDIGF